MSGTGFACALIAGLAVAYAVEEARRLVSGRLFQYVSRRQALRRVIGSLLVAALMVLVYAGLDLIDPFRTPRRFVTLWGTASMLTVLLFALAILDLRQLRAHRNLERSRNLLRLARELEAKPPDPDTGLDPGAKKDSSPGADPGAS